MRLLLADDHMLFREALVQYIERSEPEAIVLLAKDLHEVMDIMTGKPALDLVLLDLRMPGMDGLNGLEKFINTYPDVPVAILSGTAEPHQVDKAMELGAIGYFPKTMSGKAMLAGFHDVLKGQKFVAIDHNTNEVMPAYRGNSGHTIVNGDTDINVGSLTPRENDVLAFLLRGASNKEIADALDLQIVTVKLHVRGVCRKLGAKNRTQAALMAQQLGIGQGS